MEVTREIIKMIRGFAVVRETKKIIRRFTGIFGLDIIRRHDNPYLWLKKLKIRTVLDIGANKGDLSLVFRKIFPNAQIYAFEPINHVFKELNKNLKNDKNFKSFNIALGNKNSKLILTESADGGNHTLLEMTSLISEHAPGSEIIKREEEIIVKRLDDISPELNLEGNLLIKIDVQGYEDKVILGGLKTVSRAKIIILETSFLELFKDQLLFSEIYDHLKKLGFEYKGSFDQSYSSTDGVVLQQDAIFLNKK